MARWLDNRHVVGLLEGVRRLATDDGVPIRPDGHALSALEGLVEGVVDEPFDLRSRHSPRILELFRSPPRIHSGGNTAQRTVVLVDLLRFGQRVRVDEPLELPLTGWTLAT